MTVLYTNKPHGFTYSKHVVTSVKLTILEQKYYNPVTSDRRLVSCVSFSTSASSDFPI